MTVERRYISVPERWGVHGELIAIPVGQKGQAAIFGISKCRAIIKHIKDIEKFVEDRENERHANTR